MPYLRILRFGIVSALVLATGACHDEPTLPEEPDLTALGIVKVQISGLGTPRLSAVAETTAPPAESSAASRRTLTRPADGDGSEVGNIQLEPLATGSFSQGVRGAGGARYVWATFRVRNARSSGVPYDTPRRNLTFFAASVPGTVEGTAVSNILLSDGRTGSSQVALQTYPTGNVYQQNGALVPNQPDVLQVITEAEAAGIAAPGGVSMLPYGFVVRNGNDGGRVLPASPAPGQFDGVVTFAFRISLQPTEADDPRQLSLHFLAVDDAVSRITQSLEEQNPAGETAFLARAAAISATTKTVLPGMGSYVGDASTTRTLCTVRTAGVRGSPTATLVRREITGVTLADSFPGSPLWAGGNVARDLHMRAISGAGTVDDVPVQASYGTPGVLLRWNRTGVRLVPRASTSSTTVTAQACGHTSETATIRVSGINPAAAGIAHVAAVRANGTVAVWGRSSASGELDVPTGLASVVQVAAGDFFTVALRSDGSVVAWGDNQKGQLNVPAGLTDVVQVAAGNRHVLAVRSDGTVVGWGDNGQGQAAPPAGLTDVVLAAAGEFHSVALKRDGTVVAWGNNATSQTVVPPGLSGVVHLSAGTHHTLALRSDGTVVAWGWNRHSQTSVPPGLTDVVQVHGSGSRSMALRHDGTIVAWGRNNWGQGSAPPGLTHAVHLAGGPEVSVAVGAGGAVQVWGGFFYAQSNVPVDLPSLVEISAGGQHSLGLRSDGTVVAWGVDGHWNAGLPSGVPLGVASVAEVSAGEGHSLVVETDGDVTGWGWNNFGQSTVPAGLTGVTQVSAGYDHSLAVRSDGTVAGWGANQWGETTIPAGLSDVAEVRAGQGISVARRTDGTVVAWGWPYNGATTVPAGLSNVVQIAVGHRQSLALRQDGTVVVWGGGAEPPPGLTGVTRVAAGGRHFLALRSDGTVVAWGSDVRWQTSVPTGLGDVVDISAGRDYSVALKGDGSVVAWGDMGYGSTNSPPGLLAAVP